MRIAVDTNLLVYAHNRDAPEHGRGRAILKGLPAAGHRLVLASQVLAEFYSVTTDPRRMQRPLDPAQAREVCAQYLASPDVEVVAPHPSVLGTAIRHAAGLGVRGPRFFDTLLAFTLIAAGVDEFHTRNTKDFAGIPGLRVVDPLA